MMIHGAVELRSLVSRNNRLSAQPLDDEIVMANLETGEYFGLDSCGRRIWELLSEPTSVGAVCDQLMREYSVDHSQCEREVIGFVQELHREGLVQIT